MTDNQSRGVSVAMLGLTLALGMAVCSPEPPPPPVPPPIPTPVPDPQPEASVAERLLEAHNAERKLAGRPPLALDAKLTRAAQAHCDHMARTGSFGHNDAGDGTFVQRIRAAGYRPGAAAENIAQGMRDVRAVMAAWMGSPGHRANIFEPFRDFGGALAVDSGGVRYWTTVFASPGAIPLRAQGPPAEPSRAFIPDVDAKPEESPPR